MARIEDTALVLKCTPYRETSAMVSLFCKDYGRITAVQKGYRRSKKTFRIEPFSQAEVTLIGRSSLMTLTQFETIERYSLQGDELAAGFYVYELLTRGLADQQVEEAIFTATVSTLKALQQHQFGLPLRRFERLLLEQLGYGIDFGLESDGVTPIEEQVRYQYTPQIGFARAQGGQQGILGHRLRCIQRQDYCDQQTLRLARELYQSAMQPIVGDKPLVSRTLLQGRRPQQ